MHYIEHVSYRMQQGPDTRAWGKGEALLGTIWHLIWPKDGHLQDLKMEQAMDQGTPRARPFTDDFLRHKDAP